MIEAIAKHLNEREWELLAILIGMETLGKHWGGGKTPSKR